MVISKLNPLNEFKRGTKVCSYNELVWPGKLDRNNDYHT